MISNSTEGGMPAFPIYDPSCGVFTGVTIRDYFAAKALQAIVAKSDLNSCGDFVAGDGLLQHCKAPEYAANTAYQFADAMIKARTTKQP